MNNRAIHLIVSLLIVIILFTACGQPTTIPEPGLDNPTDAPAATQSPTETEVPTEATAVKTLDPLPAEPQPVTIISTDGTELKGYYYPAAVNPAPLVVLMHWAVGDMSDWNEVAVWLQNRGQANPFPNPGSEPWWDPTWFPAVPADKSYAVLVFTFRGCLPFGKGCQSFDREKWLQDAQSTMLFAHGLEGVDPARIVAVGSSIGADGAPDGCEFLNEQFPGSCQGSLSLSPGGYLTIPYEEIVAEMGHTDPPTPAWCLADEIEIAVCETAKGSENSVFNSFMIQGGGHGNDLLKPDLDPLPMQLILDFLDETRP